MFSPLNAGVVLVQTYSVARSTREPKLSARNGYASQMLTRFSLLHLANGVQLHRGMGVGALRELGTLVLCEPRSTGSLAPPTLNALTAAAALKQPITALVAGSDVMKAAEAVAKVPGVTKVLVAQHERLKHQLAEPLTSLVVSLQKKHSFTHILAPGSAWGKNSLPRAAALLGVQPAADVTQVLDSDTYVRPVYAGNALATVKYSAPGVRMLTVRPSSFPPAPLTAPSPAPVAEISGAEVEEALTKPPGPAPGPDVSQWVEAHSTKSERPELGSARVVVCGGRALKTAENFKMLESLADAFEGGAVGASRAAVDGGMAPNDLQVGQTGKTVAPDLYIGIGISGAIQHVAGIKDSKVIVAINSDKEAPLFQMADYGLVGDLFQIIPEFEKEVRAARQGA